MQEQMNSCKENEIRVFGCAMENILKNDENEIRVFGCAMKNILKNDFQCLVTF